MRRAGANALNLMAMIEEARADGCATLRANLRAPERRRSADASERAVDSGPPAPSHEARRTASGAPPQVAAVCAQGVGEARVGAAAHAFP